MANLFDFGLFNVIEYDEIADYGQVWLVELDMGHSTPLRIIVLENWANEDQAQFTSGQGPIEGNFIIESLINRYPQPEFLRHG